MVPQEGFNMDATRHVLFAIHVTRFACRVSDAVNEEQLRAWLDDAHQQVQPNVA